jgi:O-antigen/teichoic acid export membrane protein
MATRIIQARLIYPRVKRLGREFFWIGLGQAVAAIAGIVGVRLLTGALSPSKYGELALGMTVATLANQVILAPLSGAFLRFFAPAQQVNQTSGYLRGVLLLLIQATCLLLGLACLFALGLWMSGQTEWLGLIFAALIFSLLSGYKAALDGIQNAARQRAIVAWHQGLGEWLRFLTAAAMIALLGAFSFVAMAGYALATLVVIVSQLIFFRRKVFRFKLLPMSVSRFEIDQSEVQKWVGQMRAYAWPFTSWGLFTWAQVASDRWALQTFGSTSTVGLYAVLYQLGYYPIVLLSIAVTQLASPVLFSMAGDGTNPQRMNQTHQLNNWIVFGSIMLSIVGFILALFFHHEVFVIFVSSEYQSVSPLLPLMVLSGGLFAAGQLAVQSKLMTFDTRSLMVPKIVTASLGILLNFAGAYAFGLRGVVFANISFSAIYFLWILYLTRMKTQNACPV